MRKVLALILPALLLLTACGGSGGGSTGPAAVFDTVKITATDPLKKPTVTVKTPITQTQPAAKVLEPGTGAVIGDNQVVTLQMVGLNAQDGSALGDTYTQNSPMSLKVSDAKNQEPELYAALVGAKVGSRIGYYLPMDEAKGISVSQLLVLQIVDAKDAVSEQPMSQGDVEKLDAAGGLPGVSFDGAGVPTLTIPKTDPPKQLVVKVLTPGDGPALTADSKITADYVGVQWSDGSVFDSSYKSGDKLKDMALNQLIKGWQIGLAGQKVGSTVLLVIPGQLAYGDNPSGNGQPSGTLAFVLHVISAS